ncbi:MAG: hypothetical protein WD342_09120 [Verrucomicrobiales bacterium]
MNARAERNLKALDRLGEGRFIAFLRSQKDDGDILAVKFFNDGLDEGVPMREILTEGDAFGYQLEVSSVSADRFRIDFGCLAGPEAGDGGTWEVEFDGDRPVEVVASRHWVC